MSVHIVLNLLNELRKKDMKRERNVNHLTLTLVYLYFFLFPRIYLACAKMYAISL